MATEREEYFTEMLDHLNEYDDRHGQIFPVKSSQKIFSESWKRKNNISNATSITLHVILHFSLQWL